MTDDSISVECTQCGEPKFFTTTELLEPQTYICTKCGVKITTDPTELQNAINEAKKSILDSLGDLFN